MGFVVLKALNWTLYKFNCTWLFSSILEALLVKYKLSESKLYEPGPSWKIELIGDGYVWTWPVLK